MATRYGNVQPTEHDLEMFMAKVDDDFPDGHWYIETTAVLVGKQGFIPRTAAWLLFKGPLTETERVVVKCNAPFCCNPDHLEKKTVRWSTMGQHVHRRRRRELT
jgi:hypothetical protein